MGDGVYSIINIIIEYTVQKVTYIKTTETAVEMCDCVNTYTFLVGGYYCKT